MPATRSELHPLEVEPHVVGIVKCQRHHDAGCLIGQIELTRIHVQLLFLPRGAGSNATEGHLFTMSKDPPTSSSQNRSANFVSLLSTRNVPNADQSVVRKLKFQSNRMVGGGA